ncbi:hypothetical protein [Oryza sativa Japonica Group]|uniref:Uncharacterized protein n=1 Tax=Oryza sativa subsp. japonica TaxID=39947 RepID=Q5NBE7_ORYSJ|nr:hypothetical protein [Oryza sativa Japonica Group]
MKDSYPCMAIAVKGFNQPVDDRRANFLEAGCIGLTSSDPVLSRYVAADTIKPIYVTTDAVRNQCVLCFLKRTLSKLASFPISNPTHGTTKFSRQHHCSYCSSAAAELQQPSLPNRPIIVVQVAKTTEILSVTQQLRPHCDATPTPKRANRNDTHEEHQPKLPKNHFLHEASINNPIRKMQCVIVAKLRRTPTTKQLRLYPTETKKDDKHPPFLMLGEVNAKRRLQEGERHLMASSSSCRPMAWQGFRQRFPIKAPHNHRVHQPSSDHHANPLAPKPNSTDAALVPPARARRDNGLPSTPCRVPGPSRDAAAETGSGSSRSSTAAVIFAPATKLYHRLRICLGKRRIHLREHRIHCSLVVSGRRGGAPSSRAEEEFRRAALPPPRPSRLAAWLSGGGEVQDWGCTRCRCHRLCPRVVVNASEGKKEYGRNLCSVGGLSLFTFSMQQLMALEYDNECLYGSGAKPINGYLGCNNDLIGCLHGTSSAWTFHHRFGAHIIRLLKFA